MKYIVETISTFRQVHVVEADSEFDALYLAEHADDNWQDHLGVMKYSITECTEQTLAPYKAMKYFWDGVASLDADRNIKYVYPDGRVRISS
jgi:hypothetical protein